MPLGPKMSDGTPWTHFGSSASSPTTSKRVHVEQSNPRSSEHLQQVTFVSHRWIPSVRPRAPQSLWCSYRFVHNCNSTIQHDANLATNHWWYMELGGCPVDQEVPETDPMIIGAGHEGLPHKETRLDHHLTYARDAKSIVSSLVFHIFDLYQEQNNTELRTVSPRCEYGAQAAKRTLAWWPWGWQFLEVFFFILFQYIDTDTAWYRQVSVQKWSAVQSVKGSGLRSSNISKWLWTSFIWRYLEKVFSYLWIIWIIWGDTVYFNWVQIYRSPTYMPVVAATNGSPHLQRLCSPLSADSWEEANVDIFGWGPWGNS